MLKEVEVVAENEKDPAWNCLVGTEDDIPCPVCGSHAWKRYGAEQHVACRKCGKQILTHKQKIMLNIIRGITLTMFVTIASAVALVFFFR